MQVHPGHDTFSATNESTTTPEAGPGYARHGDNDATEQPSVLRLRPRADIRGNIVDLTQSIKSIRRNFSRVSDVLSNFDRGEYVNRQGNVLKLRPQWRELSDRFEDILKRSCETAIAASSMMQHYNVILDQVTGADPTQLMALKRKIQSFLNKLEGKVPVADQMERDLRTLVNDVHSFAKNYLEDAPDLVSKKLANALQGIQKEIEILNKKLESESKSTDDHKRLWLVAGVLGIVALGVLGYFVPPAYVVTGGMITTAGYGLWVGNEYNDVVVKKSEIEKKKAEASLRLNEVTANLEECKMDLIDAKQEVASTADKLATIGSIWRVLEKDMRTLVEDIDNAVGPTMDVDGLSYIPSINISREVYRTLSEYLSLYARVDISLDDD